MEGCCETGGMVERRRSHVMVGVISGDAVNHFVNERLFAATSPTSCLWMKTCGLVWLAERTESHQGCDSAKICGDAGKKSVAMATEMHHFSSRLCVIALLFPRKCVCLFIYLFISQFVSLPAGFWSSSNCEHFRIYSSNIEIPCFGLLGKKALSRISFIFDKLGSTQHAHTKTWHVATRLP